ncbi:HepT-like ribonuclease domain-containing protein [Spirosoma areae]
MEHALDAIAEIEDYIAEQTFAQFLGNSMMRFACIKQLEIIGEACNHIDVETIATYSDVEWRKIVGLRNFLIHEYFGVDAALVWDVIQNNLPQLKSQLNDIVLDM